MGSQSKVFLKDCWKKSEKSNQPKDLQKSEDEEPSYALTICKETARLENSMCCTVDAENITYLLNILGLATLAHDFFSPINLLSCTMCNVSISLFNAVIVVCRQPKRGNYVAMENRWIVQ